MSGRTWIVAGLLIIVIAALTPAGWGAVGRSSNDLIVTAEFTDVALGQVLTELSKKTGYEILMDEGDLDTPVTIRFYNVNLVDGLRTLLRQAGIRNHAIGVNPARKQVRIFLFHGGSHNRMVSLKEEMSEEGSGIGIPTVADLENRPDQDTNGVPVVNLTGSGPLPTVQQIEERKASQPPVVQKINHPFNGLPLPTVEELRQRRMEKTPDVR